MSASDFYSRPWAVAVAWWVGIIGFVLGVIGVYWGYQSFASRELICTVDPATTQIVKAGQSSQLSVSYHGQPITGDITAAQVVLWNEGKLPIKKDEILKPLVLATSGQVPILEATLRAKSRDVTGTALDVSDIAKGRVGILWSIFEKNDGVRVQLIFAGGVSTKISLEGIIEGQGSVKVGGRGAADLWPWVVLLLTFAGSIFLSNYSTNLLVNEHPPLESKIGPRAWKFLRVLLQASAVAALTTIYISKTTWLVIAAGVHPPASLTSASTANGSPTPKLTP